MWRSLLIAGLLALPASADPVRFTETMRIDGVRFPVPMELTLVPRSETALALRLEGDLTAVQKNLPAILSQHIENTCDTRTSIAVTDVVADGSKVRLAGQLQARRWTCRSGERGGELFRQTADVETVLGGRIENGCLVMRVISTDLRPDGLSGALMNLTGFTDRMNARLEAELDEALREDDACIELPEEFQAFDAEITGGGFREIGEGGLGAVITARMSVSAANFVELMHVLGRNGKLGD